MESRLYSPKEVAEWLDAATVAALEDALEPPADLDEWHPLAPLLLTPVKGSRQRGLAATLDDIAAGLEALGPLEGLPMLPRRVLRDAPTLPERKRRGRAKSLPTTIVVRRLARARRFWAQVVMAFAYKAVLRGA